MEEKTYTKNDIMEALNRTKRAESAEKKLKENG